ncbi:hypothetical protein ACLOAV_010295 [Pseudogymnoascus australis]
MDRLTEVQGHSDQLAAAVKSLGDNRREADSSDQLGTGADADVDKDRTLFNRAKSSILASIAAIKVSVEFRVLPCIPFDESLPIKDLADLVGVPESQLVRFIRLTATCGFLREPISGFVSHSPLSAQFITNQSLLDATVFISEFATPTALQVPQATQRFDASLSATESAYNLALNTVRPFHVVIQERSKLRRQWSAYLCHAAGLNQEGEIVEVLSQLNWPNLGLLRASGGIMLALTTRLLPEPSTLFNPEFEAVARARDLNMLQLAYETEMKMSELLSIIKTVGDSAGKLVVTNHLRSNNGVILALTIKYQAY